MTGRLFTFLPFILSFCIQLTPGQRSILRDDLFQLRESLHQTARKIQYAHRSQAFTAVQQAHLLIERFKQKDPKSLDEPVQELDNDGRDDLRVLQSLVDLLTKAVAGGAADFSSLSAQLSQALHRIELDSHAPRIVGYSPILTASSEGGESVQVEIRGAELEQEEAFLEIGGIQLVPVNVQVNKLNFELSPTQLLANDNGVSYKLLNLTIRRKTGGLPWVGWFKKERDVSFSLPLYLLPAKVGNYTLQVSQQKTRPAIRRQLSATSRTATAARRECVRYGATPGWLIEESSILVEVTRNENADTPEIREFTGSSFCVQIHVRGRGALGRGRLEADVSWKEYQESQQPSEDPLAPFKQGELKWGEPLEIPLPETTQGFLLILSLYDGTETKLSGPVEEGVVQVEYEEEGRQLRISPVSAQDAMVMQ